MSGSEEENKYETNNAANLMKLIFILGIVLYHEHITLENPYQNILGLAYREGGGIGNVFFFMISGFFISQQYSEKLRGKEAMSFKEFVCKRLASIYPLYFASNVIQLLLALRTGNTLIFDVGQFFLSLIFVTGMKGRAMQPNFPTWFISELVLCYLLFYVVAKIARDRVMYRTLIIAMMLLAYSLRADSIFVLPLITTNMMNFFTGCVLAEVVNSDNPLKKLIYAITICLTVAGILLAAKYGLETISSDNAIFYSFLVVSSVIYLCSIPFIIRICDNKFIGHIGKLSTPIFFWHVPVFTLFYGIYARLIDKMYGEWALPVYLVLLLVTCEISNLIFPKINKWFYRALTSHGETGSTVGGIQENSK